MDTLVSNKSPKLILLLLLVLFFACSKKNLVYYVPSNTSKAAVSKPSVPFSIAPVMQRKTVTFAEDSPTTPTYDSLPDNHKEYSFSENESNTETAHNNPSKNNNNGQRKGRYVTLIVGLALLFVGAVWMILISNSTRNSYESVLNGCINTILSLALLIAGLITTIIGAVTAAIN